MPPPTTSIAPIAKDDDNSDSDDETRRPELPNLDWIALHETIIGTPPDLPRIDGIGSNNWVIGGQHTATGLPLLADDPHLGIQMPSIWYENSLHAPGWDVVGFIFPGVPGVVIGHNDRIAWGVTNVGPDAQDLYLEKLNPNNDPLQYEFEGEWEDVEVIEEVIKVNGGEDVVLEVRLTHHGPILNEVEEGINDVLAVRWVAHEPTKAVKALYLLDQAQNFDDFRAALEHWAIAPQNFIYADVDGNIGYQTPGWVPIRPNDDGLAPKPGWTGEHEWEGWIPYDEMPTLYNPDSGYIVTANNAVVDADYPYQLSLYWNDGDRAQRITDLIEAAIADGDVTAQDLAEIQFDSYSLLGERYQAVFDWAIQ